MDIIEQKVSLFDLQKLVLIIGILAFLLDILIAENAKRRLLNNNPFWTQEEEKLLSTIIRVVLIIATLGSLYIAYNGVLLSRINSDSIKNENAANIELIGAVFTVVAAIIIFFAEAVNEDEELVTINIPPSV